MTLHLQLQVDSSKLGKVESLQSNYDLLQIHAQFTPSKNGFAESAEQNSPVKSHPQEQFSS